MSGTLIRVGIGCVQMEILRAANTLTLPQEITRKAPLSCHEKAFQEALGTSLEAHDQDLVKLISIQRFDSNIEQALITQGIGGHRCPTIDKWAAFAVAGGIIAALSEKYITPPKQEPLGWVADLESFTWEALWQAFQENPGKLDHPFMAAMLREFLPREHYSPPDRPYQESYFASNWRYLEYPDTLTHSIGHIRQERIQKGNEALAILPQDVAASIHKVTPHIPTMLEISNKRIKKTYLW